METKLLNTWKRQANQLKMEIYAFYLAYKDPRVPWYAKILIFCAIGYAFSPIDKFLNSIPIIGYLDHLILVPLGVAFAFKKMMVFSSVLIHKQLHLMAEFIRMTRWSRFPNAVTTSLQEVASAPLVILLNIYGNHH